MPDLMTADSPSVSEKTAPVVYGLFLTNEHGDPDLVLKPDSFIGYSYMNESKISQYPQEAGAFQQYNKVDTPFDLRVTMTKGGKTSEVSKFIEDVESLVKATDREFYTLITPERNYFSVNVYKVSHDHKPGHGANMVTVEIYLTEIRVSGTAQYANTDQTLTLITDSKSPTSQSPQSAGTVQPAVTPPVAAGSVSNAIAQAEIAQNHKQMSH